MAELEQPHLVPASETQGALAALAKKQSFLARLKPKALSKPSRKASVASLSSQLDEPSTPQTPGAEIEVRGDHSGAASAVSFAVEVAAQRGGDVYEWATVYENQRGAALLGVPYYAAASLLPFDPPAFAVVRKRGAATGTRAIASLNDYTLPDPSWRWVSKHWMVDMRSDGAVQYDGFEYNWAFCAKGWRGRVGGWVRRRRWVRLMVRPADAGVETPLGDADDDAGGSRHSDAGGEDVWQGEPDDWDRVHARLKALTRDGRKLEVWRAWLGVRVPHDRRKQWTEDDNDISVDHAFHAAQDATEPIREEWLIAVLRQHGRDILHTFVFPDSRAQFIDLLLRAGLAGSLSDSGIFDGIDFYSRSPALLAASTSAPTVPHTLMMVAEQDENPEEKLLSTGSPTHSFDSSSQEKLVDVSREKEQAAQIPDKVERTASPDEDDRRPPGS
ncbi:hypothetical protein AURDEDRAFT_136539 [Auricularia subglabra TFB-10046 SS5]|nr:hypothetical protein AURDEDRAFT_136539 [Auricularia subglabra TFB-10046 SS5]